MYQLVTNEYGEPMGYENVLDPMEEEERWCEEMQMRADDPLYAAYQEAEYWYARACEAFKQQGVEVPEYVKDALAREMRAKKAEEKRKSELDKIEPMMAFLRSRMPEAGWYANYYGETPEEYAHIEVDYTHAPYKDEFLEAKETWRKMTEEDETLPYMDDYLVCSTRYMKERE